MEYRFLQEWVKQNESQLINKQLADVRTWRDSLLISFKTKGPCLHILLNSSIPLIFLDEKSNIPFRNSSKGDQLVNHLKHSILTGVILDENDRIIVFTLNKIDIFNQNIEYKLILELIPRQPNLILALLDHGGALSIIDCWRYITLASKSDRQVVPGALYQKPSHNNFIINEDELSIPFKLAVMYPKYKGNYECDNINGCFHYLLYNVLLVDELENYKARLISTIEAQVKKKERKLLKLETELKDSNKYEIYKKFGELLKYNLHACEKGKNETIVTDFFSSDSDRITIPLQEHLSPQDNMKSYFKKYKKGLNGREKIAEQIERTNLEIDELLSDIFDVQEIDLMDYFEVVESKSKGKRGEKKKELFKHLKVNEDWDIFMGRTSRENDLLTCKTAKPTDWWFHSRVFHGTHLVLRNYRKQEPNNELIIFCSRIAAYYSKAKNSTNVPVDYTQIRYVSKPHGAAPGYVIYKNQKTLFVTPISIRDAANYINENQERFMTT